MDATKRTTFEETPENLAAEEAAFEAAINGTDIEAPAPETTATSTDQTAEVQPAPENNQQEQNDANPTDPANPAAEAAKQEPAEPTVKDLLAIIEEQKSEQQKLRDRLFGKIGELQQKVEGAKTTAHSLSPKARERLESDFPELAALLFDPADASTTEDVTQQANVQVPDTPTAAPGDDPLKAVEIRLLTRDHRDWRDVVVSPEFQTWKETVASPEDAAALDDTWDADFISAKITEFKTWRAGEAQKTAAANKKQERLNAALIPQGRGQRQAASHGEDDEEAAMLSAFKPR